MEKDPNHGHLASGLLHSKGGSWKRDMTPRQSPTQPQPLTTDGSLTYQLPRLIQINSKRTGKLLKAHLGSTFRGSPSVQWPRASNTMINTATQSGIATST
jgi:hypothetical protein